MRRATSSRSIGRVIISMLTLTLTLLTLTPPVCGEPAAPPKERALRAFKQGDYRKAAILLGNCLKADPKDYEAHYLMGLTEDKLQRYPSALQHLVQAHRLKPKLERIVKEYGFVLENYVFSLVGQQEFDQAAAVADEGVRQFPESASPHFSRGVALFERWRHNGDPADHLEALASWKTFRDREPLSGTADILNGIADFEGRNYEAALGKFESAQFRSPNNPYAPMWSGLTHAALDQYDEAETELTRALVVFGKNSSVRRYLGDVKALQGCLDDAEQQYREALTLKPSEPVTLINLALVYEASGKLDLASDTLREAVALRPGDFDSILQLARLHLRAGRPDSALATLRRGEDVLGAGDVGGKTVEERKAQLLLERGLTYLARGDRTAAGEQATRLIQGGHWRFLPESAKPRFTLFRGQVGDYDEREKNLLETLGWRGPEASEMQVDAYVAYGDLRLQQERVRGADGRLRDRYVDAMECYYQAWRRIPPGSPRRDSIQAGFEQAKQRKIRSLLESIPAWYILFGRSEGATHEAWARAAAAKVQALSLPAPGELWSPTPRPAAMGRITPDELQGELSQNLRVVMGSSPAVAGRVNLPSSWLPPLGSGQQP